jgi:hypothetical protein
MLLRDITKVKEFIPVNNSLSFGKLHPFVGDAERIIETTIGTEFYTELDEYITSLMPTDPPTVPEVEPSEKQEAIIKLLQDSISYLAFDLGFDIMNTTFSDQGMHRIETADGTKKALFQRQEENLRQAFRQQGYNKLEYALNFLEKNKADYATWTASEAYTMQLSNFINSATEFSRSYNINNNRLVFQKLRSIQTLVEDFDILPLIGRPLFDELKTQIKAANITQLNKVLIEFLKKAIAYRCIYRGGLNLAVELSEIGFGQIMFPGLGNDNIKSLTIDNNILTSIINRAEMNGQAYLKACEGYLKKYAASYPLFVPSSSNSLWDLKGSDKIGII